MLIKDRIYIAMWVIGITLTSMAYMLGYVHGEFNQAERQREQWRLIGEANEEIQVSLKELMLVRDRMSARSDEGIPIGNVR